MDDLTIQSNSNSEIIKRQEGSYKKNKNAPHESFEEILDKVKIKTENSKDKLKKKQPSEVRKDLVNKYRLEIKKGNYDSKSFDTADKIVQKIRDERSKFQL